MIHPITSHIGWVSLPPKDGNALNYVPASLFHLYFSPALLIQLTNTIIKCVQPDDLIYVYIVKSLPLPLLL